MKESSPVIKYLNALLDAVKTHKDYVKAVKTLEDNVWSTDFLVHLLQKTARDDVKITITNHQRDLVLTFEKVKNEKPVLPKNQDFSKTLADYMLGIDNGVL